MYAEVILSRRFPKSMGIFDYAVPPHLQDGISVGQRVSISFRRSLREGVVIKIKDAPIVGKRILPIAAILDMHPVMTQEQIALARWMSEYYCVSLGTVAKSMLPDIPKGTAGTVLHQTLPQRNEKQPHPLGQFQIPQAQDNLIWMSNSDERQEWVEGLMHAVKGQLLILCPEISLVEEIVSWLDGSLAARCVIFHSRLTVRERYDAWRRVARGEAQLILGTKLALFLPFHKLAAIAVDHEEDDDHKQYDQNPRFDARLAAKELVRLFRAKLFRLSFVPQVETVLQAKAQAVALHLLSPQKPIEVVSLLDERAKRNFTLISDRLFDLITRTLASQDRVFLFTDRRGRASAARCRDCNTLQTCSNCHRPLVVHSRAIVQVLLCHFCGTSQELTTCPRCGSVSFRFIGGGTQRLEKEVRAAFPRITVDRLDHDTGIIQSDAHIVIGTEWATKRLDLSRFGLVGIASAETLMHLPDYRSAERSYQRIMNILSCAAKRATRMIQTFAPDHPSMRSMASGDPMTWYEQELKERESLGYPPFGTLIKLIYSHRDARNVERERMKLLQILTPHVHAYALDPQASVRSKRAQAYVVIKEKPQLSTAALSKICSLVPDTWMIDRDPISLL